MFIHSYRSEADKNAYVVELRDETKRTDEQTSLIVESTFIPVDAPAHEVIAAIELLLWRQL